MATDETVSRREFEMLSRQMDSTASRLNDLDAHGTRGVGTLTTRIDQLVKDLAELKAEMERKFAEHQALHERDKQERVTGRRWLIGTGIAGLIAMVAVITLLIQIRLGVH